LSEGIEQKVIMSFALYAAYLLIRSTILISQK